MGKVGVGRSKNGMDKRGGQRWGDLQLWTVRFLREQNGTWQMNGTMGESGRIRRGAVVGEAGQRLGG